MVRLDEDVRALVAEPNVAILTTLTPRGAPVATVVWIDVDGDDLLVNTERHRRKYRNVRRDPRVHVLVVDLDDPGRYAAVEGIVTAAELGPGARAHIDRLSRKYQGSDFDATRIVSERVVLRITPLRQHVRGSRTVVE
jgi:PPOX class probable F420-dependent enzyme